VANTIFQEAHRFGALASIAFGPPARRPSHFPAAAMRYAKPKLAHTRWEFEVRVSSATVFSWALAMGKELRCDVKDWSSSHATAPPAVARPKQQPPAYNVRTSSAGGAAALPFASAIPLHRCEKGFAARGGHRDIRQTRRRSIKSSRCTRSELHRGPTRRHEDEPVSRPRRKSSALRPDSAQRHLPVRRARRRSRATTSQTASPSLDA